MTPIQSHVFIRPSYEHLQGKFGIIIPNLKYIEQAPTLGTVVHTAANTEFKVGDHVVFERGRGLKIDIEGEELLLMKEEFVLAKF